MLDDYMIDTMDKLRAKRKPSTLTDDLFTIAQPLQRLSKVTARKGRLH